MCSKMCHVHSSSLIAHMQEADKMWHGAVEQTLLHKQRRINSRYGCKVADADAEIKGRGRKGLGTWVEPHGPCSTVDGGAA